MVHERIKEIRRQRKEAEEAMTTLQSNLRKELEDLGNPVDGRYSEVHVGTKLTNTSLNTEEQTQKHCTKNFKK